jgi:hypothetical protein
LTKLKQSSTLEDFISVFEKLDFHTERMSDDFFWEYFISGIKDEIHDHALMARTQNCVEDTKRSKEEEHVVSSQTRKISFIPRPKPSNPIPPPTPLNI